MKTKLTLNQIANMLGDITELSEATLEEMDDELRKTSTCIVLDKDEIKSGKDNMVLRNGKIGCFFMDLKDECLDVEVPIRHFIKSSIDDAYQDDMPERFVSEARQLAKMLNSAANKVERAIKKCPTT